MYKRNLEFDYYNWLCHIAFPDEFLRTQYSPLLAQLHNTAFYATHPLDQNREADGVELRYKFGHSQPGVSDPEIATVLDNRPCSILEMMVALVIRCENEIADDPIYGDRTSLWFQSMLQSLGLYRMKGPFYDSQDVDNILSRFLKREYEPNGKGGLFYIPNTREDLRTVEIWYQMCWYMNTVIL